MNKPHIFVIGNEKGGAGKTTCAMHLIVGLLENGYKVGSIDTDSRQHSLTTYLSNRNIYNDNNPGKTVLVPHHIHISQDNLADIKQQEDVFQEKFIEALKSLHSVDYLVIDTPGTHSFLSKLAHSYADTIITPINDSFVDIDVMAKVDQNLNVISPSIYSRMIWEQKMQKAARDHGSIEWVVIRNRLSNLDAINKRNVEHVLNALAKRISFKVIPGFSERVIFRELFLYGLTLLDLTKANYDKPFSISHVAARQELRDFLKNLRITKLESSNGI